MTQHRVRLDLVLDKAKILKEKNKMVKMYLEVHTCLHHKENRIECIKDRIVRL